MAEPVQALNGPAYRVWSALADGGFHSGEDIARTEGVSRAAIAKAVSRLRSLGVEVQAVTGRGYRLGEAVELLEAARIGRSLRPATAGTLSDLRVVASVDSTNAVLMSAARAGAGEQALLAEWQTSGRGRRGRAWLAPPGRSLCLSVLLQMPVLPCSVAALSLAVGISIAARLEALGLAGVSLKWPNDLLGAEGKLGGVLLEMLGEPEGPCAVVVGVGLNLAITAAEQAGIDQPVSDLRRLAADALPGRNALAAAIIDAICEAGAVYKLAGFAPFLPRWSPFDRFAGEDVVVQLPNRSLAGVARGIDEQGALRLETDEGIRLFGSGEVSLRAAVE